MFKISRVIRFVFVLKILWQIHPHQVYIKATSFPAHLTFFSFNPYWHFQVRKLISGYVFPFYFSSFICFHKHNCVIFHSYNAPSCFPFVCECNKHTLPVFKRRTSAHSTHPICLFSYLITLKYNACRNCKL